MQVKGFMEKTMGSVAPPSKEYSIKGKKQIKRW